MTSYAFILFVHVAAVLSLFAALTLEVVSLFRLRRAVTLGEIRLWLDPVPGLPVAAMGSLLVVVFSGIYLTLRMSAFGEAWPKVTMGALFLVAPLAAISGRRMRAIRRASMAATAIHPELRNRIEDPFLKLSLGVRIAVILGIVLLMGAKPDLWESAGIIAVSLVLGVLPLLLGSPRAVARV
jgi:hypothetical protein